MKILKGDALEKLKELESESIDCIVTSPPYWQLRDYEVEGQLGLEKTLDEYMEKLLKIFDEAYRVLKETGTCFINIGDSYSSNASIPVNGRRGFLEGEENKTYSRKSNIRKKSKLLIPQRIAIMMIERGWILRNEIIWKKPNIMPESVEDRFTNDFEHIYFFTKSEKYYFKKQYEPYSEKTLSAFKNGVIPASHKYLEQEELKNRPKSRMRDVKKDWLAVMSDKGRNMRAVWEIATIGIKEGHFATFPEKLVRRCLMSGCPEGGIVLDMFLGSGTTLKVARDMCLESIGIEIKEEYINLAVKRIGTSLFDSIEIYE